MSRPEVGGDARRACPIVAAARSLCLNLADQASLVESALRAATIAKKPRSSGRLVGWEKPPALSRRTRSPDRWQPTWLRWVCRRIRSKARMITRSATMSAITIRPPGTSTRAISATARLGSGEWWNEVVHSTALSRSYPADHRSKCLRLEAVFAVFESPAIEPNACRPITDTARSNHLRWLSSGAVAHLDRLGAEVV